VSSAPEPCASSDACATPPPILAPLDTEGWDDPPGTGVLFVFDSLALGGAGPFARANDFLRQGLLGGETLLIVEIAGLDLPFGGDDPHVTVKLYGARDADEPFFPANNFRPTDADQPCCQFRLNPQSVFGGQARARLRGAIVDHRLETEPGEMEFTLTVGVPPYPEVRLEQAQLSAILPSELTTIVGGELHAAVPISTLSSIVTSTANISALDLMSGNAEPDVDLDGDGLEHVERDVLATDGRIARCFDGSGARVPPFDSAAPWTCAMRPSMADGYSAAASFHGVRAEVVGIGQ
jgi:hypothetical protein